MLVAFTNFTISLLIGLLIGIERERSHAKGTQAGVRTFILFSIMGTIAATLNQILITTTICLFVFTLILVGYYRSTVRIQKKTDMGITTEISAGIVFCLGYMVPANNLLAAAIGALVLLVLFERKRLHTLAREKIESYEIEAIVILAIFILGILPVLPDKTIDPWNLFNPRKFGILIATIGGIQFAGYIAIRLFGGRLGLAISGFLGGLVSSTAVFANLNTALKNQPRLTLPIIASAIFSILAMLIEIVVIIAVASLSLLGIIIKPIFVMGLLGFLIGIILLKLHKGKGGSAIPTTNPLHIKSIIYTAIFIALTLIFVSIAKNLIGAEATVLVSFLGGLFEIHGISLATALLYINETITGNEADKILYSAILASFISKFFLLFTLTPIRFALFTSFLLLIMLCGGILTFWFF